MKKIAFLSIILIFFAFISYKVKIKLDQNRIQQSMTQNGGSNVTIPLVKTLEVTLEPIRETLELIGNIEAETEIPIQPRISGRLITLMVEEGSEVKKGDLIGVIDDEAYMLQVQQTEANIIGIKANLEQAKVNASRLKSEKERYRELLDQRYISQWEYEQVENAYLAAEANLDTLKAQLKVAEKNYQLQKLQLEQTRIYAPISGYILRKLVTPGINLTSGTTIVTMASLSPVKLVFNIDQKDAVRIQRGMSVNFVNDAVPNRIYSGKINQVAPVYDPKTRTLALSVNIDNDDRSLLPGMFGIVTVLMSGKDFALVVPQEAIVVNSQKGVFVVGDDNVVQFQPVKTGLEAEGRVEVVSGLKTGDKVVVVGQNRLRNGQLVEVFGAEGKLKESKGNQGEQANPNGSTNNSKRPVRGGVSG
jgi:RND family efflux transporter MFP subunit